MYFEELHPERQAFLHFSTDDRLKMINVKGHAWRVNDGQPNFFISQLEPAHAHLDKQRIIESIGWDAYLATFTPETIIIDGFSHTDLQQKCIFLPDKPTILTVNNLEYTRQFPHAAGKALYDIISVKQPLSIHLDESARRALNAYLHF